MIANEKRFVTGFLLTVLICGHENLLKYFENIGKKIQVFPYEFSFFRAECSISFLCNSSPFREFQLGDEKIERFQWKLFTKKIHNMILKQRE